MRHDQKTCRYLHAYNWYEQGVSDAECRRAAAAAEELYRREFDAEAVPPEDGALLAEHQVGFGRTDGWIARMDGMGESEAWSEAEREPI
jgi:hypothetical protein